ncbi:MAG: hypothetical protein RMJ87_02455 [Cytophagales bacterium]|nr:hypothetical protein [Bernardetiaceae bacterium]MDW8203867.1 hypothetical protein [Cytophagales bacterium]
MEDLSALLLRQIAQNNTKLIGALPYNWNTTQSRQGVWFGFFFSKENNLCYSTGQQQQNSICPQKNPTVLWAVGLI